jgi:hypothetical protein
LVIDRDYNASLNIKEFGLIKYREGLSRIAGKEIFPVNACGDTSNKKSDISDFGCVSMKQEAPSFSCGV